MFYEVELLVTYLDKNEDLSVDVMNRSGFSQKIFQLLLCESRWKR